MQTYNPNPVKLTTIETPQDVLDDVVVGTVNPALETLADGVTYTQLALLPGYARASVADGTYASGDWLDININAATSSPRTPFTSGANTGVSGGSYIQLGDGTGTSFVGWWRIVVYLVVTTDPVEAIGDLKLWGGQSSDPTTGTQFAAFTSMRSDSLGRTIIHGERDFYVSGLATTTKLFLENSGFDIVVSNVDLSYRQIQIEQLSRE